MAMQLILWKQLTILAAMAGFIVHAGVSIAEDRMCTYQVFTWNAIQKRSINFQTVQHPYGELSPEEIDPQTGCSVCSEDQEQIHIPPLKPFSVCKKIAPKVRSAIMQLMEMKAPIFSVVGYRVGKTRGDADIHGNRTRFSNHSFGIAIDLNPELNGLYHNCLTFGSKCRLIRGGAWRPGVIGTLELGGGIVMVLKAAGFLWGGEIAGKQKDFMHFSLTGY